MRKSQSKATVIFNLIRSEVLLIIQQTWTMLLRCRLLVSNLVDGILHKMQTRYTAVTMTILTTTPNPVMKVNQHLHIVSVVPLALTMQLRDTNHISVGVASTQDGSVQHIRFVSLNAIHLRSSPPCWTYNFNAMRSELQAAGPEPSTCMQMRL
jgi:hypothetical protein